MAFTIQDIKQLLALPYVGNTVILRLQEVGLDDVATLASSDVDGVLNIISHHLHSTCWRNSPQAKLAISHILQWAQHHS